MEKETALPSTVWTSCFTVWRARSSLSAWRLRCWVTSCIRKVRSDLSTRTAYVSSDLLPLWMITQLSFNSTCLPQVRGRPFLICTLFRSLLVAFNHHKFTGIHLMEDVKMPSVTTLALWVQRTFWRQISSSTTPASIACSNPTFHLLLGEKLELLIL